jgi:hypothetical protein
MNATMTSQNIDFSSWDTLYKEKDNQMQIVGTGGIFGPERNEMKTV